MKQLSHNSTRNLTAGTYFVYLLAQKKDGVLYVGVTNDLVRRIWEHKEGLINGFSKDYHVKLLVWFEQYTDINLAIQREKQIKKWKRQWKMNLIEADNPQWEDLYERLLS